MKGSSSAGTSYAAAAAGPTAGAVHQSKGMRVDESKNKVQQLPADSDDDDSLFPGPTPGDLPPADEMDLRTDTADDTALSVDGHNDGESSPENEGDGEDSSIEKEDAEDGVDNPDGDVSVASSDNDSDEPEEMYADLASFGKGKISYRMDEKANFWWAVYDKLTAKEMRTLLKSRGQGVSGTRALLMSRLHTGDKRRLCYLQTDGRYDKLRTHEANIAELLKRKKSGARSRSCSRERTGSKQQHSSDDNGDGTNAASGIDTETAISVEDASETGSRMDVDSDAEELFPKSNKSPDVSQQPPPAVRPAQKKTAHGTPPSTIATKSTASTAPSSVSSLQTPATVSSLSGRLLNTRPRQDTTIDGVANFVSISCPPSKDKNDDPASSCHATLRKVFTALKKVDPDLTFYPIWDAEPGCEEIPPLTDPKRFPETLDQTQV